MSNRPNILLITADQWRGECLGAAGHPVVKTPNLDALAAQSTLFSRHYAPCAPCAPARASLHTGLYQMIHRVTRNGTPLDRRFDNIAKAARRAAYTPALFGYTDTSPDPRDLDPSDPALLSYEGVLPGFDLQQGLAEDDAPWLSWLAGRGREPHPGLPMQAGGEQPGAERKTERVSTAPTAFAADESQTAFLSEAFLAWVRRQNGPWFAHLSFLRPHPPFSAPAPFNDMYTPGDGPDYLRADSPQAEPADHPYPAAKRAAVDLGEYLAARSGPLAQLDARDFDRIRAIYYGMISEVDAQIGRICEALRAMRCWEETLLVFTSDHGEMMGDHWMLGKGGFYEQSYHIPLILKVPGGSGGRVELFTSAVDIFPTLLEAMDVAALHEANGRSLLPLARGEQPADWRDAVLWEFDYRDFDHSGRPAEDCSLAALRSDDHLYVHSPADHSLLYDLRKDPACLNSLAEHDSARRLRMAEALLSTRTRCLEQTLSKKLVWEWSLSSKLRVRES